MAGMKIAPSMSGQGILAELGRRVRQQRIAQNQTQAALAQNSGVPLRTIERIEAGTAVGFDSIVQVLRALNLAANLDQLVPETNVIPMQMVGHRSAERRRASLPRSRQLERTGEPWVWGDRK